MTREDIIHKMQEAGLKAPARGDFIFIHWDQIAMLLDHERAEEREACAQLCENLEMHPDQGDCWDIGTIDCADAIRARSNT